MHSRWRTWTRRLGVTLVAPLVLAAGVFLAAQGPPRDESPTEQSDPISVVEDGTIVYMFDAISGQESLFDRAADPQLRRNLAGARAAHVGRLRRVLLARKGVESLQQIRARHRGRIDRLRAIGYM